MAQSGIFRTSMRGFKKQEVLQYIEEMNSRAAAQETAATAQIATLQQEVTQLREALGNAQQALSASEENATQLQDLVNDYRRTVKDLGDSAAKADALNRERVELHAQKVQAEQSVAALKVQLEQAKALTVQQQEQIDALSAELATQRVSAQQLEACARQQDAARQAVAENRRYRALIGHVGTFVADVRQMNQSILDSTCREGVELTEAIEAQLTILEAQLADSRQGLAQLRQGLLERQNAVNERLDTMMQRLEQNAQPKADEGV